MSKDWIKMRCELDTHPKVVRIMSAINADKCPDVVRVNHGQVTDIHRTIGGLHAVWKLFDTHTDDGILRGYTLEILDTMIRWAGFSRAMESEKWLIVTSEGIVCPEFDVHNSKSAKARAEESEKRRLRREAADKKKSAGHLSGQIADKCPGKSRTGDDQKAGPEKEKEKDTLSTNVERVVDSQPTKPRFIKPTLEEVRAYVATRTKKIDPERFFDYHESIGWMRGRTPMKNWQAAVRTWEKNDFQSSGRNGSTQPNCLDAANYVGAPCMSEEEAGVPF